jgi:outer membrane lipoprotein SlyB
MQAKFIILIYGLLVIISGCASTRPVLYPNSHLNTVGMEIADADINTCMAMAKNAGADKELMSEVATESAEGGIIGGATGAAVGAVLGHAGHGAATGAAGGATAGLTRSLLDSDEPDPIFQKFVDRCLRDKGYELVGWR